MVCTEVQQHLKALWKTDGLCNETNLIWTVCFGIQSSAGTWGRWWNACNLKEGSKSKRALGKLCYKRLRGKTDRPRPDMKKISVFGPDPRLLLGWEALFENPQWMNKTSQLAGTQKDIPDLSEQPKQFSNCALFRAWNDICKISSCTECCSNHLGIRRKRRRISRDDGMMDAFASRSNQWMQPKSANLKFSNPFDICKNMICHRSPEISLQQNLNCRDSWKNQATSLHFNSSVE